MNSKTCKECVEVMRGRTSSKHMPKPYQDGRLIIKSNMQMKYNVFFIHLIVDLLVLCVQYQIQTDFSFMINSFVVTMRVWGVKDGHQN